MFELIERLRQKPEHKKKQIAFIISFSLAFFIFIIWLSVIYPDWKDSQNRESAKVESEIGPSFAVGSTIKEGFSSIGEQFKKIKETISSFSTQPEYYSATTSSSESPDLQ